MNNDVYDKEDELAKHDQELRASELRALTGIDEEEEKAIENSAQAGAARDIIDSELDRANKKEGARNQENSLSKNSSFIENDTGKFSQFLKSKKKKIIGGTITGFMISGLGFGGVFLSGPFQFLQLANMLKDHHWGSNEKDNNDRMQKVYRWMKDPKNPERRRMGNLGNKVADKYDAKLKSMGFTSEYGRGGYLKSWVIDPTKSNKSPEGLVEEFKNKYSVDSNIDNGKVRIDSAQFDGIRGSKKFRVFMTDYPIDGKVFKKLQPLTLRTLKKRVGITMSPIKRADKAAYSTLDSAEAKLKKKYDDWIKARQERTIRGVDVNIEGKASASDTDSNGDGSPDVDPEAETRAQSADKGKITQAFDDFHSSSPGRLTGWASLVVGIGCMVYQLAERYDEMSYQAVNLPLIRFATEIVSLGSQIHSGENLDMDQLGFYIKTLVDENKTSWAYAATVQSTVNKDPSGKPEMPDYAKPKVDQNFLSEILGTIPGVDAVCGFLGSFVGQAVTFVFDFTGGPISATVGLALSPVIGRVIDFAMNAIVNDPVDVAKAVGPVMGNFVSYGSRLAANEEAIATGGVSLTQEQEANRTSITKSTQTAINSHKSLSDRIGSLSNSSSLVSRIIQDTPLSLASVRDVLSSTPKSILKNISSLTFSKASAETYAYDYGFPAYGFSNEDIEDPMFENPFQNAEVIQDRFTDLSSKYAEPCFGVSINSDGKITIKEADPSKTAPYVIESNPDCTGDSEDLRRVRFYIKDMTNLEATACYLEVDDTCDQFYKSGITTPSTPTQPGSPGGSKFVDTSNMSCPASTKDLGTAIVKKGASESISIRLCQIPSPNGGRGFDDVNVSIAQNMLSLINDASQQTGLKWGGGGFRTSEEQISLRKSNCGTSNYAIYEMPSSSCSPPTARPGRSNHELGLAIDFTTAGGSSLSRGDPYFNWLKANAAKYGLKNLPSEAWHWSVDGN